MLKKVYSINFIFGNYSKENKDIVNDYGFIRKVSNPDLNNEFINLYLVRLDLISKMVYNVNENKLVKWGKFMIAENMNNMEQIGKDDKAMEQSIEYVQNFLKDNGTTFQDRLTYEKNKGRDEGREEQALVTARNMINKGYSVEEIMSLVNLSKEEIEALK